MTYQYHFHNVEVALFDTELQVRGGSIAVQGHQFIVLRVHADEDVGAQFIATAPIARHLHLQFDGLGERLTRRDPQHHLDQSVVVAELHYHPAAVSAQREDVTAVGYRVAVGQRTVTPSFIQSRLDDPDVQQGDVVRVFLTFAEHAVVLYEAVVFLVVSLYAVHRIDPRATFDLVEEERVP